MQKLFKKKTNDMNERLFLMMSFAPLEEVGMYFLLYLLLTFGFLVHKQNCSTRIIIVSQV